MSAISLYARPSPDFAQKLAHSLALLKTAAAKYSPLTQASSLGAEDMVITHLMHEAGLFDKPGVSIFVLDTGMLHAETVALVKRIEERYPVTVDVYHPDADATSAFVEENGPQAMYKSLALRKQCCHIRKMAPLDRALAGKKGWLTGLRREQSAARAEVHDIEQQPERTKVNPLVEWTQGDIWHCISANALPYNPMHDQFFPSIGCAPCTRAVTLGEDFRSGRWWWENESAKECGLHVAADGTHEAQEPAAFEPLSSIIPIREIPA
ncbi:Phosphoadenylyl-sulfate reductase [thioredoxin] / Adenylyl-sulfate reductase [thioredoxin] [Polaromonas sp. CG9_12]|nr:Phosphoadenylyl-sulfate reductase [thioredoxin] / Adenylyl-sulfate reductase [thioredoxin] [Polaromonas sp. CG9_12]